MAVAGANEIEEASPQLDGESAGPISVLARIGAHRPDYFYPKVGGVESHVFQLAQMLIRRGHHVVVCSHAYQPLRCGVRYLSCGLKVYYIPLEVIPPKPVHATLPAFFHAFPHLRQIFVRERIQLVHAHVALSALGMEAILHARTMGLKAVFTDHSLLGLGGHGELWGNKVFKACVSDLEAIICVSHTGKENTVLRGSLEPSIVRVIPNAVIASSFRPAVPPLPLDRGITIVCVSRLVHRKGIDLLIAALPKICAAHSDVRFVIGALMSTLR